MIMRKASIERKTKETDIKMTVDLDGSGKYKIDTQIPFFNHMLESFSKHSSVDLDLTVRGDIDVDYHHTIEDTGIALGSAIKKALGDKKGIQRFSDASVPLDEALTKTSIDISGRAFL